MRTADFDYDLPPELIAQHPAEPRDASRLLVLERASGTIAHRVFSDLPNLLSPGDLLVLNDTRVMAARLRGTRDDTGGKVEALLLRPESGGLWEVLFRPARAARPGQRITFDTTAGPLEAKVVSRQGDTATLNFAGPFDPETAGQVPLPPYVKAYNGDPERYQTVYSRAARSAAAPTAGLHFTHELLNAIAGRGIEIATVTLHVGAGTFKPVTVEDPRDHQLHPEFISVNEAAATAVAGAKREGRRVVAVGTTVVRTLEHVARERSLGRAFEGWTQLRILPGDPFQVVDGLVTNFHLPRSTLLMLVAAFAGRDLVRSAYAEAIRERYRFYSFGDAMFIL